MFDVVVGNPPYGKNSNLAISFLNLAGRLSEHVYFVVPRTFRKSSALNRIDLNLELVSDTTVPDPVFPGSIITCWQHWRKSEVKRERIEQIYSHPDFEFVNKEQGVVAVGRIGGPCGRVYDEFSERSPNSHYFLRVKDVTVIQRLRKLEKQFKEQGWQTVACPSLSKSDLIKIYTYDTQTNL